jgi:HEPN domain-containing protein
MKQILFQFYIFIAEKCIVSFCKENWEIMSNRSSHWLNQAVRDLEQAEDSRVAGRHEWACFAAHQSAEKAVKALHLYMGQEAWGHVVARLLEDLPADAPEDLIEAAQVLDNFYIPTRYPNGHPQGAPLNTMADFKVRRP